MDQEDVELTHENPENPVPRTDPIAVVLSTQTKDSSDF